MSTTYECRTDCILSWKQQRKCEQMGGRSINTEQAQINSSVHCASATSVLLLALRGALTLERSLIITK